MKRNKNIASFLFSAFSAGMLSQALMSSASGTDILETEKLVKEAELQQNSSSTDDENIEGSSNIEEEVQDIGANDNNDTSSAGTVYIDRNKVNGALANKQLIKVASFLLPTLGVGALGGSAYHFLKKEDKNKEPSEVNTEIKDEDEPNLEDTKGEKEDNKVTDNLNTSTLVWCYVIAIVVVLIIVTLCVYYIKSNKEVSYLFDMLVKFEEVLKKYAACVKFTGKTIVVGDLHFNTGAALFVKKYFEEKVREDYNLVFLGDFIDRGQQATGGVIYEEDGTTVNKKATAEWRLKTLEIIMDLKIKYPDKVIVLSGNHEADSGIQKDFYSACRDAFGEVDGGDVYKKANAAFRELPKCAVLEQKDNDNNDLNTFLVHGSVPCPRNSLKLLDSEKLNGNILNDMSNLDRKKFYKYEGQPENVEPGIVSGMVWNDYRVKDEDMEPKYKVYENDEFNNTRNSGYFISEQSLKVFKKENNIQRVISAHDHTEPYVYHKNVNYIKVITSPNMNGGESDGYILDIDEQGNIEKIEVKEVSYEDFKQQEANNISNIDNKNFKNNINNNIIIHNIDNIN